MSEEGYRRKQRLVVRRDFVRSRHEEVCAAVAYELAVPIQEVQLSVAAGTSAASSEPVPSSGTVAAGRSAWVSPASGQRWSAGNRKSSSICSTG